MAADPAERRHQLELLRAAFIPWLAAIDPDTDTPVRRRATWTDLPEDSRPLVDRMVDKRLLVTATRDDPGRGGSRAGKPAAPMGPAGRLAGRPAPQPQDRRRPAPHRHRLALQRPRPGLAADRHPAGRRGNPGGHPGVRQRLAGHPTFLAASREPKTSASPPRKNTARPNCAPPKTASGSPKTASGPPKTASGPPKTASGPHGNFRKPPRRMPPRCANAPKSCAECSQSPPSSL